MVNFPLIIQGDLSPRSPPWSAGGTKQPIVLQCLSIRPATILIVASCFLHFLVADVLVFFTMPVFVPDFTFIFFTIYFRFFRVTEV